METVMNKGSAKSVVHNPELTHGTMGCHALAPTRAFYEKEMRLRCVQHAAVGQLVTGSCEFGIACLRAGDNLPAQGPQNQWVIAAPDEDAFEAMYADMQSSDFVSELGPVLTEGARKSFLVKSNDSIWWKVTNLNEAYYDALFEAGDVAV